MFMLVGVVKTVRFLLVYNCARRSSLLQPRASARHSFPGRSILCHPMPITTGSSVPLIFIIRFKQNNFAFSNVIVLFFQSGRNNSELSLAHVKQAKWPCDSFQKRCFASCQRSHKIHSFRLDIRACHNIFTVVFLQYFPWFKTLTCACSVQLFWC